MTQLDPAVSPIVSRRSRPSRTLWVGWALAYVVFCVATCGVPAQGDEGALLVRIPVPLKGSTEVTLRLLDRILADQERVPRPLEDRLTLVMEFWPSEDAQVAASSSFESCLSLAKYLASPKLDRVKTVAYIPRTVLGHAILPVMACEQIVMHPDAELGGNGVTDESRSDGVRAYYREIADRRRTIPAAIALGMLDPSLKVLRVMTDQGARFELEEDLPRVRQESTVQAMDTVFPEGSAGRLPGRDLRLKWSLVSHLVEDRLDLASVLGVRASSLEPDPSLGKEWSPVRVAVEGIMTPQLADQIQRTIDDQIRKGMNLVVLAIDSPGGSLEGSTRLAAYLASLDRGQVRTVAYVAAHARADASLVATACDHLVMRADAILGGAGETQPSPEELQDLRPIVQQWAEKKSRRWSLPVALIDPGQEVYKHQLEGSDVVELFCEEEWRQQPDPTRWIRGEAISIPNEPLRLDGTRAESLGLLTLVADHEQALVEAYGLKGAIPHAEPNWAIEFVYALASPRVAWSLLFFAGFAVMAELATPGIGAGAFIATLCLVLYFWSQFLHGTANWLEIVLFLVGLGCVALELLVLPGFGIFGFGGGVLVLSSLVLATQTFVWPHNTYQYEQLPLSLLPVLAGGGGLALGLVALRHYLHRTPFLRHVMLLPPEGEALDQLSQRETLIDHSSLLGEIGVTATRLMPSGRARILDRLVDVITDGEAIDAGVPVEVIQARGSRVVVRARPMSSGPRA